MSDKISPQTSSEPAVAGGAGFGNKSSDGFGKADSTIGKVMEKVGNTIHIPAIANQGTQRRASAGFSAEPETPK